MDFTDRLVTAKLSSEITCAIGFGYTANYSLVLQLQNFFTSNDLQYTVVVVN